MLVVRESLAMRGRQAEHREAFADVASSQAASFSATFAYLLTDPVASVPPRQACGKSGAISCPGHRLQASRSSADSARSCRRVHQRDVGDANLDFRRRQSERNGLVMSIEVRMVAPTRDDNPSRYSRVMEIIRRQNAGQMLSFRTGRSGIQFHEATHFPPVAVEPPFRSKRREKLLASG